ncbi:MAG: DUF503 domain-containing protein [Chloroflexi bacterium]|nr:DUF503 domain-containing protein [Chloroflexota bacterium]MCH8007865.1 DUF503 domain-containing protein [Chloroflexota bacterium]
MTVGVCRIVLRLPENASLKGKRRVVKSLMEKLRNKFNLAVAEVDANDSWQIAIIGLTCVSNDARHTRQMLDRAVDFIQRTRLDAELLESEIEISRAF